jgi:diacylglycerol kinase (ATP)
VQFTVLRNFLRTRAASFRHAFDGWGITLRTQPNAWIHAAFSLVVAGVCIWLRLPPRDWAVIILTITLVWAAELINTAIEAVVDLISPDQHPLAKVGKDTAAGAVLVTATGAVLIGLLILGPPLWDKVQSLIH